MIYDLEEQRKKKAGRKKSLNPKKLRTIKVSDDDWEAIAKKASSKNKSISQYMRDKALED